MRTEPRASVLVPAHDEVRTIGRALEALLADAAPGELAVVVVCNGCTDATADTARDAARRLRADVTILEIPEASKPAAIRAAEALQPGFPRIYLDADVECPTATARALAGAVAAGARVAVPRRVLEDAAMTWPARAYYTAWADLPWVREQLAGRGAYALGATARATFADFPDVVADDRFATTRVPRSEAVIVEAPVVVRPPASLRAVVRVRSRVYAGNTAGPAPAHDAALGGRSRTLSAMAADPRRWPGLAVFLGTTAVAKSVAVWRSRRGKIAWGRDAARGGVA